MKVLLAAINAKYIHSNPAVYSLRAYAGKALGLPPFLAEDRPDGGSAGGDKASSRPETGGSPAPEIEIGEYTINHQTDMILQDIYRRRPDVLGFSCYIWNIGYVMELARDVKAVLPRTEIWLGGPEVSFDAEQVLKKEPTVRGIMRGEGEATFAELVAAYWQRDRLGEEASEKRPETPELAGGPDLAGIAGITYRSFDGAITRNPARPPLPMDDIPFYYEDAEGFENRIIYYESSRGCPFSCSYCLSSLDKSVRFRDLGAVKRELDFFLSRRVLQVKFVDRTFNCSKERTMAIWRHLIERDNGVTNFHFEVSADLFDEEELELIGNMRPGLIQLEIGVQSTNGRTLGEIRRTMDLSRLRAAVERIRGFHNTHQHLDLIAGLPHEGPESFQKSFDDVYAMCPNQLQLGFLKVLKGSHMERMAQKYGLVSRGTPPYEVLRTSWMDYEDIIRLKGVEEMVEAYYNSGQFLASLALLCREFDSACGMFEAMAQYYEKNGLFGIGHSRIARYEILYRMIADRGGGRETAGDNFLSRFRDALMYDLYLRENAKSRPEFALDQTPHKEAIREFFCSEAKRPVWLPGYEGRDSRQIAKMAHMEALEDGTFLLFDYFRRDPLDHNARAIRFRRESGRHGGRDPEISGCAGPGIWNRISLPFEC